MSTPLLPQAPVVLLLLILGSGHHAVGLDVNDTYSEKGEPFSRNHSDSGLEVASRNEMSSGSEISPMTEMPSSTEQTSGTDYDYLEYEAEVQISGYIVDDSVRVEQVVKPKKNKTESEKTSDKPKRKKKGGKNGKNRRNKKKKNPCDAEFQNFCIHGECKYIENLEAVTCKCHHDYFGERCGEKSMKTHSMSDRDFSKVALAALAFISATSFTAVVAVIAVQLRKRYFREFEEEAEEQKKLQENGHAHSIA